MENPCVQISPIVITGTVTVEHLQNNGTPARRATHQNAEAALYRNEFRDILLRARLGTRSVVYSLQNAVVHKKFLREGKISVALKDEKVHLYFSNCPPSKLCTFVKFLDAKKATQGPIATVRERLKSSKQRVIEEISPLMLRDANATQSQGVKRPLSKDNQTTPTGKKSRPMGPGDVKVAQKNMIYDFRARLHCATFVFNGAYTCKQNKCSSQEDISNKITQIERKLV